MSLVKNVGGGDTWAAPGLRIRSMLAKDCHSAVQCFHGHYDVFDTPATIAVFRSHDPEAFFVATDTDDHVVGVCGAPLGPQNTRFLGLYGVRPSFRDLGIGSKLFQRCMEHCVTENVGLYAVPEMREKYEIRSGFSLREGVSMVIFAGVPKLTAAESGMRGNIVRITKDNRKDFLNAIIAYDQRIHRGETRTRLLELSLNHPDYCTCIIRNEADSVVGYGCLRRHAISGRFYIGPLYGDSSDDAAALAQSLMQIHQTEIEQNGLVWNALDVNPESIRLAASDFGLAEIERCERIFTKHPIDIDYPLVYSVFSPDFSV